MSAPAAGAPERTFTGIPNGKLGMWVFLASEVMLFGALISSYVVLAMGSPAFGRPDAALLGKPLATFNTFVLLASSAAMMKALAAIQKGRVKALVTWIGAASGLGVVFLAIKSYEYVHKFNAGITLSGTVYGSFYYTLTGLHVIHLAAGLVWNAYIAFQAQRGTFTADGHARVEYAGLYWHFVDLIWVILFPLLYLV